MARGWDMQFADRDGMILERVTSSPEIMQKLELSTNQVDQLKAIQAESASQMTELRAEMEKSALKQAELMSSDSPNEEEVMKAVQQTADARTKIAKLQIHKLLASKKVLSKEQLEKARTMVNEWRRGQGPGQAPGMMRGAPGQAAPGGAVPPMAHPGVPPTPGAVPPPAPAQPAPAPQPTPPQS